MAFSSRASRLICKGFVLARLILHSCRRRASEGECVGAECSNWIGGRPFRGKTPLKIRRRDPRYGVARRYRTLPIIWGYAYDPDAGTITPVPSQLVSAGPIRGSAVKVGKNPGGDYVGLVMSNGSASLPSPMDPGKYNIVVTVPAHAINAINTGSGAVARTAAAGTASATATVALPKQPMLLTFHVVVDGKGHMTMSQTMRPSVTAAPSREPTQ